MLFGGDGTHCFARKTKRVYEKENPCSFLKKFLSQSQSSTPEPKSIKGKNHFIYGIIVSTPHWFIHLTKNSFPFSYYTLSVCSKATWFSQSPMTVLRGSLDFGPDSDTLIAKRSRPGKDNRFSRNSSGSLELVVVSKTRLFEKSSSASYNYSQPGRNYADEGRSALKCRRTRFGHKRVSSVWSGWCWSLLGKWSAGYRRCLQTRHR